MSIALLEPSTSVSLAAYVLSNTGKVRDIYK
jgi:hypothetical protein